jgi:hypothetical protein
MILRAVIPPLTSLHLSRRNKLAQSPKGLAQSPKGLAQSPKGLVRSPERTRAVSRTTRAVSGTTRAVSGTTRAVSGTTRAVPERLVRSSERLARFPTQRARSSEQHARSGNSLTGPQKSARQAATLGAEEPKFQVPDPYTRAAPLAHALSEANRGAWRRTGSSSYRSDSSSDHNSVRATIARVQVNRAAEIPLSTSCVILSITLV